MNAKRLLALILSLCMTLTVATFPVMAEEPTVEHTHSEETVTEEITLEEPASEDVTTEETTSEETTSEEAPEDMNYQAPAIEETAEAITTYASSGTCGTNLTWTLDDSGTLTISGTGAMYDYNYSSVPWGSNRSSITSVTIGDSVTSIGSYAFCYCTSLTSVTIPDSVTSIGIYAFWSCRSLESITIPNSVTTIGDCAVYYCRSLTSVTIGDSVTSIGYRAFDDCTSLTSVTIPDSVTSIGSSAFPSSANLEFNEYDNAYYLGNNTNPYVVLVKAKDTSITSCQINTNTKIIYDSAFDSCDSLTSITIPDSVTSIGNYAFDDCTSLTSVTIGDSVTDIGRDAFRNCSSLTSITIPDSVTSIGSYAFPSSANLEFNEYDNAYYLGNNTNPYVVLVKAKDTSITSCQINTNTKIIYYSAFRSCSSLTSITIPDSVTSIGGNAFSSCPNLTSVTIGDSVTSIGSYAFASCDSLTSVTIGNGVTTIGYGAFAWCDSLTSITIPDSVTTIGDYAFTWCTSLTSITIPDSVTTIGDWAFYRCESLASINVSANNSNYTSVNGVLFNKDKTTIIQYPEGKTATSYTIPDSVTSIGKSAFSGCTSLTSVTIGDSVTSIGDGAFQKCTSLTAVTIPDSVTSIGDDAFSWCTSLTSITIPDSVTSIGDHAFSNCDSLTSITVDEGNEYYSSQGGILFNKNKTTLIRYPEGKTETTYTIPDSVTRIGDHAFEECTSLTSITIPDSVTTIGSYAFAYCDSLTSVTIPDSVTSIGDYAFYDCTSLTDVYYNGTKAEKDAISIGTSNSYLTNATWHHFDGVCDATCNDCGLTREAAEHTYDNVCDTECNVCGATREVGDHVYNNACDTDCNECGDTREVPDHTYDNTCDVDCNECGTVREIEHTYDNACDSDCNVCGETREVPDHVYDNACDADCNVCGEYRELTVVGITASKAPADANFAPEKAIDKITSTGYKTSPSFSSSNGGQSLLDIVFDFGKPVNLSEMYTQWGSCYMTKGAVYGANTADATEWTLLCTITNPTYEKKDYGNGATIDISHEGYYRYIKLCPTELAAGGRVLLYEASFKGDNDHVYTNDADYTCNKCGYERLTPTPASNFGYSISNNEVTITYYTGSATEVVIPSKIEGYPVTTIGHAFNSCWSLESVTIPDSVTSIENYAFAFCDSLASITIPDSVTTIGDFAFHSCDSLESVTIGDGVTTIGGEAFASCDSLTSVILGNSVTTIGHWAFRSCSKLTSITIPDSVTTIDREAFANCESLTSVTLGNGITEMGDYAFAWCDSLASVTISDGATTIGNSAFYSCKSLTSITIPDGLTTIGEGAFAWCDSLTSITIPDSITTIGDGAFPSSANLEFNEYDNAYYLGNNTNPYVVLVKAKDTSITSCQINTNTKIIYDSAFGWCESLTNITIPASVVAIGDSAFGFCDSLTGITVDAESEYYCVQDGILFDTNKTTLVAYPAAKTATTYAIPDTVTTISGGAFYSCDSLISISIPDSVTNIDRHTFMNCQSLESITVDENNNYFSSQDGVLYDKDKTTIVTYPSSKPDSTYNIPNGVKEIDWLVLSSSNITSITIPATVTNIELWPFGPPITSIVVDEENQHYSSQDGILFNKDKTVIVRYPVKKAEPSYTILEGVKTIAYSAFAGSDLTSVTIPDSVTSIGSCAFYHCDSLASITIPDSVTEIGDLAFCGCSSLTSVTISNSITEIPHQGFYYCTSLTSITIPDGVTSIARYAFEDCSSLASITIPDSVTSIKDRAFSRCTSLTDVYYSGTEEQRESIAIEDGNDPILNATWYYNFCGEGNHVYNNACDADCNECGATRTITHKYDNACDTSCNVCGETRTVAGHVYSNACDTDCNECGYTRVVSNHVFDNRCDTDCNVCGALREANAHVYDNEYDATCNECGETRDVGDPYAPTFTVEDTTATVGKTFTVAVSTRNNVGIVSLKLKIGYDAEVLELVSIEEKDFAGTSFGELTKNPITVLWEDVLSDNNTTNGTVALLTFRVKDTAKAGTTEITVTYDPEDVYDYDMNNVGFAVENGTVTVVEYVSGDINNDGVVNNKDLGVLRRWLNEWEVDIVELAADVNRDGKVNNKDLGILRRYLNDWDVELI